MRIHEDIKFGYVPADAPSRREYDAWCTFTQRTGLPYMSAVFIVARRSATSNESEGLLAVSQGTERNTGQNAAAFDAIMAIKRHVLHELHVDVDGRRYTYESVCAPYCQLNEAISVVHVSVQVTAGASADAVANDCGDY